LGKIRLFTLLFLMVIILSACYQEVVKHSLVHEIEGIEEFPYDFKLPTYFPFEVGEVKLFDYYKKKETLPKKLEEVKGMDFKLEISFLSKDKTELMIIRIHPEMKLENKSGQNEEQIQLSDGAEAEYYFNGNSQIVTWNDSKLNYSILVPLSKDQVGKEIYRREELIKVADSLMEYWRTD
jgi:hypothetical protein